MKLGSITLSVIGTLLSVQVYAHDLWIMPSLDAQTINASIGYGHDFPAQGSESGKRNLFAVPQLLEGKEKYTLTATDNDYFFTSNVAKKAGNYFLITEMKPAIWSKTDNGWKPVDRTSGATISYCMHTIKYTKSLFTIDSVAGESDDWVKKVVGHSLEIIPQTNPLSTSANDLTFQVLYQGQPLADTELRLDSEDYLRKAATGEHGSHHHPQYQAVTNHNGIAKFSRVGSGKWLLIVARKSPYKDLKKCDEDVYKATLSFVRQ